MPFMAGPKVSLSTERDLRLWSQTDEESPSLQTEAANGSLRSLGHSSLNNKIGGLTCWTFVIVPKEVYKSIEHNVTTWQQLSKQSPMLSVVCLST